MRSQILLTAASLGLLLLTGLSCKSNPSGPTLEPPGSQLLYDANFNSIQMNGDFSGISWDPSSPRNEMSLVADFTWRIVASVNSNDVSDGNIQFKFTHDNNWSPDNIGDSGTLGQGVLEGSPGNITLPLSVEQGFYTFELNDETLTYTTEPLGATGELSGSVSFEGEVPLDGATVTLWAQHPAGSVALWAAPATDDAFAFTNLADSLYLLRADALGYAATTVSGIRVENGEAPFQAITLSQVFGAISGTVSFSDDPDPLPEAIVVAYQASTQTEAGRDSTDALGDYRIGGLSSGIFDLRFSAAGYQSATIEGVEIVGDEEVVDQDAILDPTSAATPDPPYFTAAIDGNLDAGWTPLVSDPAGDSAWGASNDFQGFHVAWDLDNLYIAVSGGFDSGGNTVNIYVDKDYGAGTGTVDFSTISGGSVGDHLRKTIDMSAVAGYGADFAGSIWATQYEGEVTDISDAAAIFALEGQLLDASSSVVEFSVPWSSLYPDMGGGVPPYTQLGVYCVIGGGGDQFLADDSLPEAANVQAPTEVIVIEVDADGQ